MAIPRTGHQWLQPLYNCLQGKAGLSPSGPSGIAPPLIFGGPTAIMGVYGQSGTRQPTGLGSTGSAPGGGLTGLAGASAFDLRTNGGTGTNYYTFNDVVNSLKLIGILAK